jgi:O-acetyl-ADP-ribose deacetylase (regulator of RNase III)
MDPPSLSSRPKAARQSILHYFPPTKRATTDSEGLPSLGPKSISNVILPSFSAPKLRAFDDKTKRTPSQHAESHPKSVGESKRDDFPVSSTESSLETTTVAHDGFDGVDDMIALYTDVLKTDKTDKRPIRLTEDYHGLEAVGSGFNGEDKANSKKRSRGDDSYESISEYEDEQAIVLRPEKRSKVEDGKSPLKGTLIEDDGLDSDEEEDILAPMSIGRRSTVLGVVRPKEAEENDQASKTQRSGPPSASPASKLAKPGSLKRQMMLGHGVSAKSRITGQEDDEETSGASAKRFSSAGGHKVSVPSYSNINEGAIDASTIPWGRKSSVQGRSPSKVMRRISWCRVAIDRPETASSSTGSSATTSRRNKGEWKVESLAPSDLRVNSFLGCDGAVLGSSTDALHSRDGYGKIYLEVRHGDLTSEAVDCVVNAANSYLAHGGGVAGAISSKGGPSIQKESDEWVSRNGQVEPGHVAVTGSGRLPSLFVLHAVGPVYTNGGKKEETELFNSVFNSLVQADMMGCASISLPAISSGIFGYPKEEVALIFMQAAIKFILSATAPMPSSKKGVDISAAGKNISTPSNSVHSAQMSQSSSSSSSSLHTTSPFSSNRIRSLRVIRFTNFDTPTVSIFESKFDEIFNALIQRQKHDES